MERAVNNLNANARALTVIFAGGGSGGHLSPGLAIAERLHELSSAANVVFLCSHRAIDARMLSDANVQFHPISSSPLHFRPRRMVSFLLNYRRGVREAGDYIDQYRPDLVLALGGFVAAPAVAAARQAGVPVILLNLDDPPGRANRLIARRCDRVLTAIPLQDMPNFAHEVVGFPVRRIAIASADPPTCRAQHGLDPQMNTLLITGASQGATSINAFMKRAARQASHLFDGWQILHLAGQEHDEPLAAAYQNAGIPARVLPFLTEIGLAWGAADAAISRAGANSVAEVAANAVPTLFLPYPYHRDQHQRRNARPLVKAGCAIMADDHVDPQRNVAELSPMLQELLHDDDGRAAMRQRLQERRPDDAAVKIAQRLLQYSRQSSTRDA